MVTRKESTFFQFLGSNKIGTFELPIDKTVSFITDLTFNHMNFPLHKTRISIMEVEGGRKEEDPNRLLSRNLAD